MRALAYLLGARALDVARETGTRRTVPEVPMDPLATTEETASAWRRWAAARETLGATRDGRPSPARPSPQPRPTPF